MPNHVNTCSDSDDISFDLPAMSSISVVEILYLIQFSNTITIYAKVLLHAL